MNLNIDKYEMKFDEIEINKGYIISFNDFENGYIYGEFLGLKKSNAAGYSFLYVIKCDDDTLIAAPVELIDKKSIVVYRRSV